MPFLCTEKDCSPRSSQGRFAVRVILLAVAAVLGCEKPTATITPVQQPINKPVDQSPPAAPVTTEEYVPRAAGTISYSKDIAPIVWDKCSSCHHQGSVAPFSLLTFADLKKRDAQIREVVQKRIMPPWGPLPGYCDFAEDASLSANQIGLISQWIDEGSVEGDVAELQAPPDFPSGWPMGPPDLVVTMPEPFELSADAQDVYRKFAIPVPIESVKYVKAFDFDPGPNGVVHHMRLRSDSTNMSRIQDETDPQPGFDGTILSNDVEPDGFFLNWVPGYTYKPKGADVAWSISPGTDLVLELHLRGVGKVTKIQSSIALYFQPDPPKEHLHLISLSNEELDIPPGTKDLVVETSYKVPVNLKLLAAQPHAHFLATDMWGYAILPNGDKIWLMRIGEWDFNWQREYVYAQMVDLPKDTTIHFKLRYDNSADNPRNPNNPPRRVLIGKGTFDEMAAFNLQVLTANPTDGPKLDQETNKTEGDKTLIKENFLIERGFGTSESHYNLGVVYNRRGNVQQAILHYQEALVLDPHNVFAANNLGSIFKKMGKFGEAETHYRKAIEINHRDFRALNNLGLLLLEQRQLDKAAQSFKDALKLSPDFADAHANLGVISAQRGQWDEAERSFERALQLRPEMSSARVNLQRLKKMRAQGKKESLPSSGQKTPNVKP